MDVLTHIFRIEISIMPFKFKIIMSIHDFFEILRTIWVIKLKKPNLCKIITVIPIVRKPNLLWSQTIQI